VHTNTVKLLLKLLLILFVLLAGIYSASPLWLPYFVARQLPPGWQLEQLKSGYPGPAGIHFDLLRVKGELGVTGLTLSASDISFGYEGLKTDIGLVTLDVFMRAGEKTAAAPFTLEDLSLPVTTLTGKFPQLSVSQMRVVFHYPAGIQTGTSTPAQSVVLDFDAFELVPGTDNSFQLATHVSFEDSLRITGQLEVDVSPNLISAYIRFPSAADSSPWLAVEIKQEDLSANATTRIDAVLNADLANRDWLDSVLARSTGQVLTQMGGKLELQANFAGQNLQSIEHLSLTSENLRLVSDSGTLDLNTELLASREGEIIAVNLPVPVKIQYQGKTAWLDELLNSTFPGLQLTPRNEAKISSELASSSRFRFLPGTHPSISFEGDLKFDLDSNSEHFKLQSTGLLIELGDLNEPESTIANGSVTVDWKLDAPIVYTSDDLQLTADKLSIAAELVSQGGKLISNGGGTLLKAHINPLAVSAEQIDMTWQQLDLDKLTGKLGTHTQGFSAEFDNETWTGFDFDINYTLLSKSDVNGSGNVKFASGPQLPIEFAGNTEAQKWNIKLLPTTIKLVRLRELLSVAHYELPDVIKLADGDIELQGDVWVDDEVSAKLLINGHEMHASIHESIAREASFTFNTGYDRRPWANGPVSIEAFELAGGIDVSHTRFEFELESTEIYGLKNLYAEVFDGQLNLESLNFSGNKIAETTLELSHIGLGLLLAYADIDGLAGTGFLDISLPVGSDETGFHVKNGTFRAIGPGQLAYKNQVLGSSNIGLQAMENFQYKDLTGTLNYQSDGTYLITIHLDGKNPDLYGGHPVVFNLNINGSLPALFEAMFITGSFEESILKEIKSR